MNQNIPDGKLLVFIEFIFSWCWLKTKCKCYGNEIVCYLGPPRDSSVWALTRILLKAVFCYFQSIYYQCWNCDDNLIWARTELSGGRLSIKILSYQYRIPMLKIRRSCNHLNCSMGIPIAGKDGVYIEPWPWRGVSSKLCQAVYMYGWLGGMEAYSCLTQTNFTFKITHPINSQSVSSTEAVPASTHSLLYLENVPFIIKTIHNCSSICFAPGWLRQRCWWINSIF